MSCECYKITPFTPREEERFETDPVAVTVFKVITDTQTLIEHVRRLRPDMDLKELKSEIIKGISNNLGE